MLGMSLKRVVIPVLAASMVAGVSSIARKRYLRSRAVDPKPLRRGRVSPERNQDPAASPEPRESGVEPFAAEKAGGPISAHTPGSVALPRAFWDAGADQDVDAVDIGDDVPSARAFARGRLAQPDAPDADHLGEYWLASATQTWDMQPHSGIDDPAEIPADSMSMISDASRAAASLDLPEAAEFLDDVDSRRF